MKKNNSRYLIKNYSAVRLIVTVYVVICILVTACAGPSSTSTSDTSESKIESTKVSDMLEPTEVVVPVVEPTVVSSVEEEPVEEAAPVVETIAEVLLTVLTGRVDYMLPDTEDWQQALGEEIPLQIGTQLRAYQLSSARLDLADGSKVLMKPVSKIGMTTYVHEPETPVTQAFVDIPEGEAAFDVNGPLAGEDSSFLVKMPTGVFSVNPESDETEKSVVETPEEQPEPEDAEAAAENPVIASTEEELNLADVTLNVLSGRVDFLLPGADDWQLADGEAFSIDLGTEVRTYQLSMARLDLADGSKIMMKPTSKVSVTSYLHEPATPVTQAYVSVPEGEAAFDVNGPLAGADSTFMVEMPTGVFSVTGTSFTVNAGNTDQPSQINLLEGKVVAGATIQNTVTGELEAMFFEMEAGEDGAAMNFMSSEQAAEIVLESGQDTDVQQQVAAMSIITSQGNDGIEVAAESGLAAAVEQGLESGTVSVISEEQLQVVEDAVQEGVLSETTPIVIVSDELAEVLSSEPGEDSILTGTGVEIKTAVEALTGDDTASREGVIDSALQSFTDSFEGLQPTVVTDAKGNTVKIMPPDITINADGTANVEPGKLVDENGDPLSSEVLTVVSESNVTVFDPISGEVTELDITDALALPTADPLATADQRANLLGAELFEGPQQADSDNGQVMFIAGSTGVNLLQGEGVASGLGVDALTGELVPFVMEVEAGTSGTVIEIPSADQLPIELKKKGTVSGLLDALGVIAASGKNILEAVEEKGLLQTAGELLNSDKATGLLGANASGVSDVIADNSEVVGDKVKTLDSKTLQTLSAAGLADASLGAVGMGTKRSTELIDSTVTTGGPKQESLVNSFIGDFTGPKSDSILDADGNVIGEVPPPAVVFDENGIPQGLMPSTPVDSQGEEFDLQELEQLTNAGAGEIFMLDPNTGESVPVGGGQVATWGVQNLLATTDARGVGQQSMFPPVTFDSETGEMKPTVILFTGGDFAGFDAFDEDKMSGGLAEEGNELDLVTPRLPGMEFDNQGRITGQDDLSFVTFDALGQASEWAMPDPFMFDSDGEVLAVQPPPAFLFGDSGYQFGMHQDEPFFFHDDHELLDDGPQIVYDEFGVPMTTDMNMMAQIMRDESGQETGRQMLGRTTAWDDDFFSHGLALETEQFHVTMFDDSGNVSTVSMFSEPVFDDGGGWAGMLPPPILMHNEDGNPHSFRESDLILSTDLMQDIFFGDIARRSGIEEGVEGKLELDFFGAAGARVGGMEFDNMELSGNLGPEDSQTDYMPGDPFRDPFAAVPWGQGPEAFGNFNSEVQNNFAVSGFYDYEEGIAHSFDEFSGSDDGKFEQFKFFGDGGLGAPQFYTDEGEVFIAPTIGGPPEIFFEFDIESDDGELQSYGQFEDEDSFGPSVGSLVGGGGDTSDGMDFYKLPLGVELPAAFSVGWGAVDHYGGERFGAEQGFQDEGNFSSDDVLEENIEVETRDDMGSLPDDASFEQQDQFAQESEDSRTNCAPGDTICEEALAVSVLSDSSENFDDVTYSDDNSVDDFWEIANDDIHVHTGDESFNAFDYFFGGGFAQQKGNDYQSELGDDVDVEDPVRDVGIGGEASMDFLNTLFTGGPNQDTNLQDFNNEFDDESEGFVDQRIDDQANNQGSDFNFLGRPADDESSDEGVGGGFDFFGQFGQDDEYEEDDDWDEEDWNEDNNFIEEGTCDPQIDPSCGEGTHDNKDGGGDWQGPPPADTGGGEEWQGPPPADTGGDGEEWQEPPPGDDGGGEEWEEEEWEEEWEEEEWEEPPPGDDGGGEEWEEPPPGDGGGDDGGPPPPGDGGGDDGGPPPPGDGGGDDGGPPPPP